jgi:hypothetical protein
MQSTKEEKNKTVKPLSHGRRVVNDSPDLTGKYSLAEEYLSRICTDWSRCALMFRGLEVQFNAKGNRAIEMDRYKTYLRHQKYLEAFKRRFEAGNNFMLLCGIEYCAVENLPLPNWLRAAFLQTMGRYMVESENSAKGREEQFYSLDDCFASPSVLKKTLAQRERTANQHAESMRLYNAFVTLMRSQNPPKNFDAAVKAVLADPNVKATVKLSKAKQLIESVNERIREFFPRRKRFHEND